MSQLFHLPEELREAIYQAWHPADGLSPDAILALLERNGCSLEILAVEASVETHYVRQVIRRVRRSPKVESLIANRLLALGISADMVWGLTPPKRPSIRCLPDEFTGVPSFCGRFIEGQHAAVLIVDCETSGPNSEIHKAVEVAALLVAFDARPERGYVLLGALDGYAGLQDPGPGPHNPIAMRTHGIPLDTLTGKRLDLAKIRRLADKACGIVAHNASFDRRFFVRAVPELDQKRWWCSYHQVDWKGMGFESSKLRTLSESFGLPAPGHRAPGDVISLYHLLNTRLPDGRTTFGHLLSHHPSAH